ncbi:MAG: serine-type D-Ala-D-Ala carboxypeptidase, partial [Marinobacter sp.]
MAFKMITRILLLALSLTFLASQTSAQSVLIPSPPQIAGSSWVLMDPLSGRVIMEHNSDERLPPASLTKMMTAYTVDRELDEGRIAMSD